MKNEELRMKKLLKKTLKLILPIVLGGFILYWVYRDFDFSRVGEVLRHGTNWWWMLFSLLFGVLAQVFRGWRWRQTLGPPGAFREDDEGVSLTQGFAQRIERVRVLGAATVDQHAVEFIERDAAPEEAFFPIVFSRDRAHVPAKRRGERSPDHDGIEVARVVGEVDALLRRWGAALPVRIGANEKARKPHDRSHQLEGTEHFFSV